ncbi:MAG: serine/threonine protein kinase [Bdellovibrionota bacterium]
MNFETLDPQNVLDAAEVSGFIPTGEFTQLNSYENRVFHIRCENHPDVIAKFYRPQRWSKKAIQDEHNFLLELQKEELPAVAPLVLKNKKTILDFKKFHVGFFPRVLGRLPQELLDSERAQVGRLLAHIHNIGSRKSASSRPFLDANYPGGWETLDLLQAWISPEMRDRYSAAAELILGALDELNPSDEFIRIHGDCHRGNLLHNGKSFFIVDFDDFCNGPVIQDFWMLLSGDKEYEDQEKEFFLQGYEELREFPHHQWEWIPLYRGLRIISYAGWIAKRWEDPSFPRIFPEFNSYRYWAEETEALEKLAWSLT